MTRLRYLEDVVTLELDADKCIGCGLCVEVCPHAVFKLQDGVATIVDRNACMECGACAGNCSVAAISVRSGVGCAACVKGVLRGTEPTCDCSDASRGSCC